jgi:hypothetical protein
MSITNAFRQMVADAIAGLAIKIGNRNERPGIDRVESAVAIGRIFDGNAARQQLDTDIARGGFFRRLDNNSRDLGRVR